MANQRLETETNGIGICLGTAGCLGVSQQPLVDVKGLLHTYDYAIDVWLLWPSNVSLAPNVPVRLVVAEPNETLRLIAAVLVNDTRVEPMSLGRTGTQGVHTRLAAFIDRW